MTMIALTLVTVTVIAIATFLAISLGLGAFAEVHRDSSINEPRSSPQEADAPQVRISTRREEAPAEGCSTEAGTCRRVTG
jgi:hypothetical protein